MTADTEGAKLAADQRGVLAVLTLTKKERIFAAAADH